MSNKTEIYKGTLTAFLTKGISIAAGYLFSFLIALYYGSKGVGIYSVSHTLILIFSIMSILGLDAASIRFVSEKKSIKRSRSIYLKILKIVVPLGFLMSLMLFFLSSFLAGQLNEINLSISIKYIALGILPLSILHINSESLRGFKEIKLYSMLRFALIPLFSSIILFVSRGENNYNVPVLSYLIAVYITFFISIYFWFGKIDIFKKDNEYISMKYLLNISTPMLLTTSMFYVIQWIDTIILGYYDTTSNIGIYNIALKMSMASSIVLFSINSIAAPKYSQLFFDNKIDEFKSIDKFSSKLIFWLSIPLILIIALNADFFLSIFGEEFKGGRNALYILLIGQGFNVLCGSVGYILMMTDKQKVLRNIIFCSAILNIILNIALIPTYGMLGAAFASTISMILWNLSAVIYIYNKYDFITINIFK